MTRTQPTAVLMMEVEVDPADEAEVNDWYHNTHLPELCRLPGIRAARRYKVEGDTPRYVALYFLDDAAALESEAFRTWRAASTDTDEMVKKFRSMKRTLALEVAGCGSLV